MTHNPLLEFARRPEFSIKLPTQGNWYEDGVIEYSINNEVQVYPMIPKDEIMLTNPDALLTGEANLNLIKSCVPQVKQPEKLLYPDANVLFLAIRKATYGDELPVDVMCPNCQQMIIDIGDTEQVKEKEKNGELNSQTQEFVFSCNEMLQGITMLDEYYTIDLDNGLKIYISPTELGMKMEYNLLTFNRQKIIQQHKAHNLLDENLTPENRSLILADITLSYLKMNEIGNKLIANSIKKIELPDGSFIIDKDYILEFISQTNSSTVNMLNEKIKELNEVGLPSTLEYECPCCHHVWETIFYGYNQSDFFEKGSYF